MDARVRFDRGQLPPCELSPSRGEPGASGRAVKEVVLLADNRNRMITWEKEEYGFYFGFHSPVTLEDALKWADDVRRLVPEHGRPFCVFADFRTCELLPPASKLVIGEMQRFCLENGMQRSVVILNDKITVMQMALVARTSGIYDGERYIDATTVPNWEQLGLDWLIKGIDPNVHLGQRAVTAAKS